MGQVTWIEILSRHGEVLSRHRCGRTPIRIGRAYHCDVVLDDPYVAPEHVVLRHGEGGWVAEDLGSVNGLFEAGGRRRVSRIDLKQDQRLQIGRTWLRLREADHVVAPEKVLPRAGRMVTLALGLLAVLIGIEVLTVWLTETTEVNLSRYAGVPLIILLALGVWIAVWSVLSRIFAGQARVDGHLLAATAGALVYSLYNEVVWVTGYAFASPLAKHYDYIALWLIFASTFLWHLRVIGPAHMPLKVAAVALIAAAGIGFQVLQQSDRQAWADVPPTAYRLMPPEFRLAPLTDPAAFQADLLRLKQRIDKERKKPAAAGDENYDGDD